VKPEIELELSALSINITDQCNLRCRHCWVSAGPGAAGGRAQELTREEIVGFVRDAIPHGLRNVNITGGEPFARWDMLDIISDIRALSIGISMETNGTLIDEKIAATLNELGVYCVAVSLDGATPDSHEFLRGVAGSFAQACEAIRLLSRAGIPTQAIASIHRGTLDETEDIIALAAELGASSVKVDPIQAWGRAAEDEALECLSVAEHLDLHHRLTARARAHPQGAEVMVPVPPAFLPAKELAVYREICGPLARLGLLPDGRVSICAFGGSKSAPIFGSAREHSVADIWAGNRELRELREVVPHRLEGVCGRCLLRLTCLGYCRAKAVSVFGSLASPCEICQAAYDMGVFPASRLMN